jgi:hypothetical protein
MHANAAAPSAGPSLRPPRWAPLIGLAADAAGLPTALAIVCAACAVVAVGASVLSPRRPIPLEREHPGGGNFTTKTEGSHG